MEERCGGAAVKLQRMRQGASTQSITAKRMKMRLKGEKMAHLTARPLKITVRKPTFAVCAARKKVTQLMSALEIPILGPSKMFFKKKRE